MDDRHAWANGGIEQICDDIYRIPLPLPNDALRAVNVYAVISSSGVCLVDGGWLIPDAMSTLRGCLGSIGVQLEDVEDVLVTHYHKDHYTLAVALQRLTGCSLSLGSGERANLEALLGGQRASDRYGDEMRRAGAPPVLQEFVYGESSASEGYGYPETWLEDGETRPAGNRRLVTIGTPGHTQGHVCFADDAAALLFAGDHVLPHITPSIGFETVAPHLPLADYLSSLSRIRMRPDAKLLPAHGPVGTSVHARVDELLDHHKRRLDSCRLAIEAGARTAYQVARAIPWTRHERQLGELSAFDQVTAVLETIAHLDVLCVQNLLQMRTVRLLQEYEPTASA